MHVSIRLFLMVFAFVCFALSAFGVSHPRVNLQSLGLAAWVLALLIG